MCVCACACVLEQDKERQEDKHKKYKGEIIQIQGLEKKTKTRITGISLSPN